MRNFEERKKFEDRIGILTGERETAKRILDSAVESLGFSVPVDNEFSEAALLEQCAGKIRTFVRFDALVFYIFSSDGLDYAPAYGDPSSELLFFEREMELLVEDRTFAWVIDRNRPVIVTASDGRQKILLHSIITQNQTMGVFMGLLGEDEAGILDLSFAFLTVLFSSMAGILQNARLYSMVQNLNAELRGKVERLEESERNLAAAMKSRDIFLANVSHEIRTPLNGILGMASLLEDTELNGRQKGMLRILRDESNSLLRLVNDLLDFAKMEAEKLFFENIPFSLEKEWKSVADSFSPRAAGKNLLFAMSLDGPVPEMVSGDSHRLRQILGNLIGNALKFTFQGGVSVRGRVEERGKEKLLLSVEIRDTGIGISSEKASGLFQPFVQGDASTTRKFGGTGLGLVISKRIVESQDGSISFESSEGKGSVFSFSLPLVTVFRTSSREEAPEERISRSSVPENLSVLVVDDNATSRLVAVSMLKKLGIARVETAENGMEALEKLSAAGYDLVLMDIQMPLMDGVETMLRLRDPKSPVKNRHVPVAAMTANILSSDRERYLEAGMVDSIAKPILPETLRDLLRRLFPEEKKFGPPASALAPAREEGEKDGAVSQIFRRGAFLERMGKDENLCRRTLELFLSDTENILRDLEAAGEGLTAEDLERKAHILRGASANVEALEMAVIADEMERAAARGDRAGIPEELTDLKMAWGRFKAEIAGEKGFSAEPTAEEENKR